jgi:hypothetical protein
MLAAGTTSDCPSRTTVAVGELSERKEFIVFSALYSWQKPTIIFRTMTAEMTPPSIQDVMAKLTAMARIRT